MEAWGQRYTTVLGLKFYAVAQVCTAQFAAWVPKEEMLPTATRERGHRRGQVAMLVLQVKKSLLAAVPWVDVQHNDAASSTRRKADIRVWVVGQPPANRGLFRGRTLEPVFEAR